MDKNRKQILKRQLEQQAEQFVTESSDAALMNDILRTCTALLRSTERLSSTGMSERELEQASACYVGAVNQMTAFYARLLEDERNDVLNRLNGTLKTITTQETTLTGQIAETRQNIADAPAKRQELEAALSEARREYDEVLPQQTYLESQVKEKREAVEGLQRRQAALEAESHDYNTVIADLTQSVAKAKQACGELDAQFEELGRIRSGLQEEGFVNITSFNEKIREMNRQSEELRKQYDDLLGKVLTDVEALRKKINSRAKPNG